MDPINCLLLLLENPRNKKAYKDLKKCYYSEGKVKEAEAIEHLIRKKFNADDVFDSKK